jgi:DNA repair protein RecO (recombination protein O)
MLQLVTTAIVLARTNYGEADRIITVLTPDYGKLRLIAKGARREKSKLAGGIELFSVSGITFIKGRSDIGTLVSARLSRHFGNIVSDIYRVQLGYDLIKLLNKTIEDRAESDYFHLLEQMLQALDDLKITTQLIHAWFVAQLLRLGGHMPNLQTDAFGEKLDPRATYDFDYDSMAFARHDQGQLGADHIKFLRLIFSGAQPRILHQVQGSDELLALCGPLVQAMAGQIPT